MSLFTLPYLPEKSTYVYNKNSGLVTTELEGGRLKSRTDFNDNTSIVNCSWNFGSSVEFRDFMLFYNEIAQKGVNEFNLELVLDSPSAQEHICRFVPNTLTVSEPGAISFIVTANLEVTPVVQDEFELFAITSKFGGFVGKEFAGDLLEEIPQNSDLAPDTDWALSFWALSQEEEPATNTTLVEYRISGSGDLIRLSVSASGKISLIFGGTSGHITSTDWLPETDTYYHFVLQQIGSNFQMFVDGVLILGSTVGAFPATTATWKFGAFSTGGYFTGIIGDARFYSESLDADNILYFTSFGEDGVKPDEDNLTAQYFNTPIVFTPLPEPEPEPPVVITGDYYFNPITGNDSNDGITRSTPWKTVDKFNTFVNTQTGSKTYVFTEGDYAGEGFYIARDNITVTVEIEEGSTFDVTGAVTRLSGIDIQDGPSSTFTFNLRGATFTGDNDSSANGIGTTGETTTTINGNSDESGNATFTGFDDGVSMHGTSGARSLIVFNDMDFEDCSKGAFTHVNDAAGTHNRCNFTGKTGATLGIGDDQSSVKSEFNDCTFTPISDGQVMGVKSDFNDCVIGSYALKVAPGNLSTQDDGSFTSCFLNWYSDGIGALTFDECYGYFDFRIRGDATRTATFTNCIFEGRTNSTDCISSNYDAGDGNWLGGTINATDCVFYDFGTAVNFASSAQETHINANWDFDYIGLFDNNTNFAAGLTIGTNLETSDPSLGARTDTEKSSWGYGGSSPLIGAGSGGGNIGFPQT